jgi:hypothetical protein
MLIIMHKQIYKYTYAYRLDRCIYKISVLMTTMTLTGKIARSRAIRDNLTLTLVCKYIQYLKEKHFVSSCRKTG